MANWHKWVHLDEMTPHNILQTVSDAEIVEAAAKIVNARHLDFPYRLGEELYSFAEWLKKKDSK